MPDDSVCYPPAVTRFLLEGSAARGAHILYDSPVANLTSFGVVVEDGRRIDAACVVIATGAMAKQLIPELQLKPRKGHLAITDRYPGLLRHQLIELGYLKSAHSVTSDSVAFNAQPRATGQILIGSSRQFGVESPGIDRVVLSRMLVRAFEYLPDLASLSLIRSWTGFRAATPDKLPLIGRAPSFDNVFLATGHEGLGISNSLGTAKLLADEILGRPSSIPREPYSPSRSFVAHA